MYTIGMDIGGTNLVAGLVDRQAQIVHKEKCKTPRESDRALIDAVIGLIDRVIKNAGVSHKDVRYAGLGAPGSVDQDAGEIVYANNIPFRNTPACRWVEEGTGLKTFIDNDGNAAALGEVYAGSMKDCRDAIAVTLGTGIGGGIIINRKIYAGFNHAGAEVGHQVIVMNGRMCTCGRPGCWEAYASATGLIYDTREAMKAHPDSAMWRMAGNLEGVGGRTAFDAMRAGDPAGIGVVNGYIDYLACGIANLVSIFQPEAIAVGGGICNEGDALILPLRERVTAMQYYRGARSTQLRVATLGNDAGVIGAALLGE